MFWIALTFYEKDCIILKEDDNKLIIVPKESNYTNNELSELVEYQEKYFNVS